MDRLQLCPSVHARSRRRLALKRVSDNAAPAPRRLRLQSRPCW